MKTNLKSKFLGSLVGSALGDAIGELAFRYPVKENLCRNIQHISELSYTDDTAMAIGLAESIIEKHGIDQNHLGHTFRNNYHKEPWRGYASGPPEIFAIVESLGIPYPDAARTMFGGAGSFGNGAAMRVAPVGLYFYNAPDLYDKASASAEVTHAHPVGKDGAAILARAIATAVKIDSDTPFDPSYFINMLIEFSQTIELREKMKLVNRLHMERVNPSVSVDRIGRSVSMGESMPFAIYSFLQNAESFEECLFCAVLNGGDRDTLGAMACAISGAYLGIEAIPYSWQLKLENKDYIESLATSLADMTN